MNAAYDLLTVGANPAVDVYYGLDHLRFGGVNRVGSVLAAAGGKANNLARAYQRLGGSPLTSGIAGGATGRLILDALDEEGIARDYVLTEGESRRTVTLIADGATTVLLEPGPCVAESSLDALVDKVTQWAPAVPAVAIAGSLPQGVPSNYVARLVQQVRATSAARVAVDVGSDALRQAATAGAHVIKVNAEEYESAFAISPRHLALLEWHFLTLSGSGVEVLCVTNGARGALVLAADDRFCVRTDAAECVSTAGAGDAFLAGFLFALNRGDGLREAARLASATAAAALQSIGAGFIERSDVDAALERTYLLDAESFVAGSQP